MRRTGAGTLIAAVLIHLRPSVASAALPGSWLGFALSETVNNDVSDDTAEVPVAKQPIRVRRR
jgi:hypothetical protein